MPTFKEALSTVRSEKGAATGSFEDTLAQIRAAEPSRPSQSFSTDSDYLDALKSGKLHDGEVIQVGDMLRRVVPRGTMGTHDLDAYSSAQQRQLLAGRPTLGAVPISYVDENHPGADFATALKDIRSGRSVGTPAPVPAAESTSEQPALGIMLDGLKETGGDIATALRDSGLPALATKATNFVGAPAIQAVEDAYKPPATFAETLHMLRAGQNPIPAGPSAFTQPAAILNKAAGQVKGALGAALAADAHPQEGTYSRVFGKLLTAPTELALGLPPGMLGKIEDAVGRAAVTPAAQETYRQAVLSQPFSPSEWQEAIGTAGLFDVAPHAAVEGILSRFPGMAARFGFQDASSVVRQAVESGVKIPVSPGEVKSFFTGVGDIDPVVADKLRGMAGEMGSDKFNAAMKDVLAGKKTFFIRVPKESLPARAGLPPPTGAAEAAGAAAPPQSFEETLRLMRNGEQLPSPGEAAKNSSRFSDMPTVLNEISRDLTQNVVDKKAAGMALTPLETAIDKNLAGGALTEKEVVLLANVGYTKPNGPIPTSAVRNAGASGSGPDGAGAPPGAPAGVAAGPAGAPNAGLDAGEPLRAGAASGKPGVGTQVVRPASAAAPVDVGRGVSAGGDGPPASVEGAPGAAVGPAEGALPVSQVPGDGGVGAPASRSGATPPGHAGPAQTSPAAGAGEPKTSGSGLPQEGPSSRIKPYRKGGSYEIAPPDGGGPPASPSEKTTEDLPPAIQMPELVEMAKDLLEGKVPKVMKSLRASGARGVFFPGKGEIHLKADIFKDPAQAAKTLAHEIGHARDWLSDKDMGKGNILGRIASVPGYMKDALEALPEQPGKILSEQDREGIRKEIRDAILKKMGKTMGQFIADPALKKVVGAQIPALYKERIAAEVAKRGLITRDEVMAELKTLGQKWKPFDVKADPGYTEYRHSSPELYADATSVLFNDPALLKEVAPKFYKSLFAYMDRKPEVKSTYQGIIDRIKGGNVLEGRQSRVEGMFEAGERQAAAERLATEKESKNILGGLRRELIDKNEGVLAYLRKAKKMGVTPTPENNPQYALEEMNYASAESKAFLEDFNKVYGDLDKAGVKWGQLGELFFHERVVGERGEMANPLGFTPETSTRQMAHMEQTIGPEKWKALQAGAKEYREAWGRLTDKMGKSGMFSPELMQKIRDNPWYSTFDVFSKHVDSVAGGPGGIGAKIHGQIGTLQEISNPATATLMKGVSLVKAMLRNNAAKKTIDFISETFGPAGAHPAETKWNGHAHVPMTPKDPEKGLVAYMEDGKVKAFVVDKWVAKIFERDPQQANVVMDAARASGKFFREIFTNKNPGFQAFNFYRDFFRAYKNLPKISMGGLAKYYVQNLSPAWRRGFDIPDPLVREMLEKKMLITVEDKWGLSTEDEQVRALMNRYSEGGAHEEGFLSRQARKIPGANPLVDNFQAMVDWVGNVGSAIEALPKVAGYKYLKDHQAELKLSDKEIAYMVRGQVGSPDFMRTGASRWLNTIFMFSNAIKEGWRSDLFEVAPARPEEYAWKTAKLNLIPKLVMFGAAVGLMGLKMKDLMDGVPEYDKANYLIIPFGKMKNGRTFYLRMPQDESGRFLGALFWKAMSRNATPGELFDFLAGQAPTLNPVLSATANAVQYMSSKNPYDWFRGRNVVPDQVFEAGGARSHKAFLKYLANSLGASVIHQFDTNDLDKAKTDLEKGLGLPIASNIVGRFLKVSDYGKFEMIQRESMKSRQEQARTKLDERDALVRHLNAVNEPGPADAGKLYADMLKEGMLRTGRGTGITGFPEFLKEYNRFAEKKGGDPYINALVFAKSNEERADLLAYYRKSLPKDDYEKVMAQAMAEGALTAKPLMLSYIEEKKK